MTQLCVTFVFFMSSVRSTTPRRPDAIVLRLSSCTAVILKISALSAPMLSIPFSNTRSWPHDQRLIWHVYHKPLALVLWFDVITGLHLQSYKYTAKKMQRPYFSFPVKLTYVCNLQRTSICLCRFTSQWRSCRPTEWHYSPSVYWFFIVVWCHILGAK